MVLDGFGWFWMVLGGFGWFWVVPCFSNYAVHNQSAFSNFVYSEKEGPSSVGFYNL